MKMFSVVLSPWTLIETKGKFPLHRFAHKILHPRLKWDTFVSNDCTGNECKEKVVSFTDPYDVSDDVTSGPVKISTCDMLSVFSCIGLILIRRLLLKLWKGPQMIVFAKGLWKHGTWCSAATQYNTRTKRQFNHLWQLVPYDTNTN